MRRTPDDWAVRPYTRLTLEPYTEVIGAEVHGVDLAASLDDELRDEIRRALLEWKVLFFRDQQLTSRRQLQFALAFGELEHHPFLRQGETSEVVRFEKGEDRTNPEAVGTENGWHTDLTWRAEPAMGAVLRAVEVPEHGGDTLWADMACAYDNLPTELRERIDDLRAVHSFVHVFGYGIEVFAAAENLFNEKYLIAASGGEQLGLPIAARIGFRFQFPER